MPDISAEIAAFRDAAYGEEVRGSMISLANKLNGNILSELNTMSDTWNAYKDDVDGVIDDLQDAWHDYKEEVDGYTNSIESLHRQFPKRTNNILDANNITVLHKFTNTTAKKIQSNNGCCSVLIPIDSSKGNRICWTKTIGMTNMYALLPTDDPDDLINSYDISNCTRGNRNNYFDGSATFTDSDKAIFIWYYYDANDPDYDPEDILHSLMVSYDTVLHHEPYKSIDEYDYLLKPYDIAPSRDFSDPKYFTNSITFISSSNESTPLIDSPDGTTTGNWLLKNEIFRDYATSKYVFQCAYDRRSTEFRSYARFLIINPQTNEITDSSLRQWKKIDFKLDVPTELKNEYSQSPFSYNTYTKPDGLNGLWITDYEYPKGKIKTIKLKSSSETDVNGRLVFINSNDATIMNMIYFTGHGEIIVDVYEYFGNSFYLGIEYEGSYFNSGTYNPNSSFPYRFIRYTANQSANITEKTIIDFSQFNASGTASYALANEVVYESLYDQLIDHGYSKSRNSLYVIGDSITAGHNSYVIGNHWWEAIKREYGWTVKLGARTGSGMSYYNGTNACKIVTQQDLSKYDVILIAFGTNDYGNNQPLGTINDTYTYSLDSSQTFYAALHYVVQTIKSKNQTATIVFSLPINRTDHGTIDTKWAYESPNNAGHTLSDYCDAIIDICDMYCLPYIDHRHSAIDVYSVQSLLYDNLHPSVYGYKVMGCEMISRFGQIIRPYPEYDGSGGPDVSTNQY